MTEELTKKIELLENKVNILTEKMNEIIVCLDDNELSRKVTIDYIEAEEEAETEKDNE